MTSHRSGPAGAGTGPVTTGTAAAPDDAPDREQRGEQGGPAMLPDLVATDPADLTVALCDIPSVSGDEASIADAIETALRAQEHLEVLRDGDAVLARTGLGRARRAIVAGHIDTVPIAGNLPTQRRTVDGTEVIWGRGSVDMKGGVAVALHLAAALRAPSWDITWIFYDNEEVEAARNGLGRLARRHPDWLSADLAILGEPSNAGIEAGCNGTLRAVVRTRGKAAHSARAWRGHNAIHAAAEVLTRLHQHVPEQVEVDGLVYREGLNAVGITGGIAGNVIPDECAVTVNFRFAPSRTPADAETYVREVFDGFQVEIIEAVAGARPGLRAPGVPEFLETVGAVTGGAPAPKYGWTDVARFAALGIPAVNFGPGDPSLAHADDEYCPVSDIRSCAAALAAWLSEGE